MINTVKKLALSVCFIGSIAPVSMHASAPASSGVLSSLAQDGFSVVKAIGTGVGALAQGLGSVYLVARSYPKTSLALGVALPLLAIWYHDRVNERILKPIRDNIHVPGQDNRNPAIRNWAKDCWRSSSLVIKNENLVVIEFRKKFGLVNEQTIRPFNDEIQVIQEELRYLEDTFLVSHRLPLDFRMYDIRKDFGDACKERARDVGEIFITSDQLKKIEDDMEAKRRSKIVPYLLLNINFRSAAKLWWDLKKDELRLKAIVHLLDPNGTIHNVQRSTQRIDARFNVNDQ